MGAIQAFEEVFKQQEWEYLLILQKLQHAHENGCPPGFITKHDISDIQREFGLTLESNNGNH